MSSVTPCNEYVGLYGRTTRGHTRRSPIPGCPVFLICPDSPYLFHSLSFISRVERWVEDENPTGQHLRIHTYSSRHVSIPSSGGGTVAIVVDNQTRHIGLNSDGRNFGVPNVTKSGVFTRSGLVIRIEICMAYGGRQYRSVNGGTETYLEE